MKYICPTAGRALALSLLVCTVLLCGQPTTVQASSLKKQFDGLFGPHGITISRVEVLNAQGKPAIHAAHFSDASQLTLGALVGTLAPSAADFPAVSTVPGFTFRFNPEAQAFERTSTSLGPVYVERPQTVGRGKFDIGASFLYVDFDSLDGKSLRGLKLPELHHDGFRPDLPPDQVFRNDFVALSFPKFSFRSFVTSFSATYGITDRWDMNIFVPVIVTQLKIQARASIHNVGSASLGLGPDHNGVHFFDIATRRLEQDYRLSDDKIGIGDVQLRTKYLLLDSETSGIKVASGLTLRIPTGKVGNFQGLGDVTVTPYFTVAREYGRFDFHLNGGTQFNTADFNRSRLRYAGGVSMQVLDRLALLVDIIGSSNIATQRISVQAPKFDAAGHTTDESTSLSRGFRTDIVDLGIGVKTAPSESMVLFFNCFVPLNRDGLRSDFIPSAGVEMTF